MKDYSKDYVIYKKYQFRVGEPGELKDSMEFVQVLLSTSEEQVINICQRLNMECKHRGINLHYGFTELKPYDGCFDNE